MKTTLDLPDELMKSVKLRAVEENRTLTNLIAELLRQGLTETRAEQGTIRHRVKLPLVRGAHAARPEEEMTPERIADILIAQEVEAHVPMIERTAIEIDEELLEQAKTVLGSPTSRATVEEALQRVVTSAEDERNARAERQRTFFETLDTHLDLDVLKSDEMWR